jgi:hypothetical protein
MRRGVDEGDGATAVTTWSFPVSWVVFVVLIIGVLVVAGITVLLQSVTGHGGPPPLFLVLWFAVLGWNVYWWLFRLAFRVELVGDTLRWRAPLAGGAMPVAAIDGVGRFFAAPFTCVVRAHGHRSMVVFTQFRSFDPMLTALNRLNPAVPPRQ